DAEQEGLGARLGLVGHHLREVPILRMGLLLRRHLGRVEARDERRHACLLGLILLLALSFLLLALSFLLLALSFLLLALIFILLALNFLLLALIFILLALILILLELIVVPGAASAAIGIRRRGPEDQGARGREGDHRNDGTQSKILHGCS